jgi:hypothetical protein
MPKLSSHYLLSFQKILTTNIKTHHLVTTKRLFLLDAYALILLLEDTMLYKTLH